MASKRTALNDLNHENWDREEETEDAGTFAKASEEVLEKRVIKTAKRRVTGTGEGGPKSAFGSFAGFKTSDAASPSPFSFLSNLKPITSTAGTSLPTNSTTKTSTSNGTIPENGLVVAPKSPSKPSTSKIEKEKLDSTSDEKSPEYYAKLKGLNISVTQWIKKHVDSSPFCILTPIFRDYEKHLNEIELKHGQEPSQGPSTEKAIEKKPTLEKVKDTNLEKKVETSIFGNAGAGTTSAWKPEKSIFGNTSNTKSIFTMEPKVENKSLFSTSQEKTPLVIKSTTEEKESDEANKTETKPAVSLPTSTFSFGQSSSTPSSAGFSFGGAKPFTFGAQVAKPEDKNEKGETEEKAEDDEPPKPEFKAVTEEGSIFDQRCKVFVKKDGNFGDRGVGTLFLKPTSNEKMQLIVRAGNSLGNILLNTLLSESIPLKRMNKNTIMLVCIPTPDSNPPPTPVLLRVKTSEDADTLLEALEKNRK